jgi:hypothetical protein
LIFRTAKDRAGIEGYVTNLTEKPEFIIHTSHQLFEVERSFRMSKSNVKARPIHHQTQNKIEAHVTIVFTVLAISRYNQDKTGISIKRFIHTLQPLRTALITINNHQYNAKPVIPETTRQLIQSLHTANPTTSIKTSTTEVKRQVQGKH